MLCADVGQDAYEEVDELRAGANYGWRAKEGLECYDEDMCHEPIGELHVPHARRYVVDLLGWYSQSTLSAGKLT